MKKKKGPRREKHNEILTFRRGQRIKEYSASQGKTFEKKAIVINDKCY